MKTFMFVERQAGEGCDYSIGCGVRATEIQAESAAEAVRALAMGFFRDYDVLDADPRFLVEGDRARESFQLLEVAADHTAAWSKWLSERRAAFAERESGTERRKKEAEFERLKKELGK